jgi:hypothetical protein
MLAANLTNLFDQEIRIRYYSYNRFRNNTTFTNNDLMYFGAPWTPEQFVALRRAAGATLRDELLYMVPNTYQGRRDIRLQVRFSF